MGAKCSCCQWNVDDSSNRLLAATLNQQVISPGSASGAAAGSQEP
ncbi:hypothetical protein SynBIOSU31_00946 [Synechococcus sp. BIOS-U3-1]|nr:hypothetical protein SynBIOSU31_00946 [Synechococcus sp. BIOS-U3-1]